MSAYTTLISTAQLQALQASGAPCVVFDCSFELMQPEAGVQQYTAGHIPGALYAHLDTALSSKSEPSRASAASGGRHPLPSRESFAAWLGSQGVANNTQVVVYDRQGANYCGRLWWMLKWLGHANVAVLDGGLQAWQAAGGAVVQGQEAAPATQHFAVGTPLVKLVDAQHVLSQLGRPAQTVVDARGAPRFRGEVEPLDPAAGHIPGALNRPFTQNMQADGRFKPADQLRTEFEALLAGHDAAGVVHHCGSGVSAISNLLAMEIAGLGLAALYAGSWSDWVSDPARPVAQG